MPNAKSKTKAMTPRRLALFGLPLLLPGEDATAYDGLFAGIHAAKKPLDTLAEMLVSEAVALEWEVLRWSRLKSALLRLCQCEALEKFLAEQLDYKYYAKEFEHTLARTLEGNLSENQTDTAEQLAQACAQNDSDAIEKAERILAPGLDINLIMRRARSCKAAELARKYARRQSAAVKLVNKILTGLSADIDDLMAAKLAGRLDAIGQIDRLATIAENRRNTTLREIDRHHVVLGETLRRSFKEVEDAEFQVVETTQTKGNTSA